MAERIDKQRLLEELGQWNRFIKRKVHLIACGGTALTLSDIKSSTKDVDFMVPNESEHKYLTKILKNLGYRQATGSGWNKKGEIFIYDLFRGNRIHTTELLTSPLQEENHKMLVEFSHLYIGILNDYDLIASKLFRGTSVDFDDCLTLVRAHRDEINIERLAKHCKKLASFDVGEDRIVVQIDHFLELIRKEGLGG